MLRAMLLCLALGACATAAAQDTSSAGRAACGDACLTEIQTNVAALRANHVVTIDFSNLMTDINLDQMGMRCDPLGGDPNQNGFRTCTQDQRNEFSCERALGANYTTSGALIVRGNVRTLICKLKS